MRKLDLTCIIDDDPIFVFGAKRMMKIAKFCESFLIFSNGKEALKNLKPLLEAGEDLPELILLDLNMPIMDGWEFLDELIKIDISKPITIYIISSSVDNLDMEKAKEYKMVSNYIIKPISLDKIEALTREILTE